MFFESAFAQQGGEQASFGIMNLLPILLIFVIFYFLLFRPQQKKEKARQNMLSSLSRGDKVVTSGGIIGVVHRVADKEIVLEIADGVNVTVLRSTIVEIYSKDSSAKNDTPSDDKKPAVPSSKKTASKSTEKKVTKKAKADSAKG